MNQNINLGGVCGDPGLSGIKGQIGMYSKSEFSRRRSLNRNEVLKEVKENAYLLAYVRAEFQSDKEVVLAAINNNTFALEYASKTIRNDREFILEVVKKNGFALKFAKNRLKKDKEIVLNALQDYEYNLDYIDVVLKKKIKQLVSDNICANCVDAVKHLIAKEERKLLKKAIGSKGKEKSVNTIGGRL